MKTDYDFSSGDILKIAGDIASKIWTKVLVVQVLTWIAMVIVLIPIIVYIMGFNLQSLITMMSAPIQERMNMAPMMMMGLGASLGRMILGGLLIIFLMWCIGSWAYNTMFILSDNTVKDVDEPLGNVMKEGSDNRVIRLVVANLLLGLIFLLVYIVGSLVVGSVIAITGSGIVAVVLVLAAVFFLFAFFMRYLLVYPAISLGGKNALEAMSYSMEKIAWNKAFKYALIAFAVALIYGIVLAIIQAVIGMVLPSSVFSLIFIQLISLVISAFVTAYIVGGLTALYYRESDTFSDDDATEGMGIDQLV